MNFLLKLHFSNSLLFFLFALPQIGHAQNKDVMSLDDLNNRKMIVIKLEPKDYNIEDIRKWGTQKDVDLYLASIDTANNNLQFALDSIWQFNKDYQFMSKDAVMKLKSTKTHEYVILYLYQELNEVLYKTGEYTPLHSHASDFEHLFELRSYYLSVSSKVAPVYTYAATPFYVRFIEDMKSDLTLGINGESSFRISLPHIVPRKTDFAFAFDYLFRALTKDIDKPSYSEVEIDINKNKKIISQYSLIVLNSDVLSPETFMAEIGNYYPYKIKLVSAKEFEQIVLSKKEGYAFMATGAAGNQIIRASDGEFLFSDRDGQINGDLLKPEFFKRII